jgi:hypothetical protein
MFAIAPSLLPALAFVAVTERDRLFCVKFFFGYTIPGCVRGVEPICAAR